MFHKIIVGVDGLQGGRDAIKLSQALAPNAEYLLVSAYPFDTAPSRFALLGYGNALRDETEHELRRTAAEAGLDTAERLAVPDPNPARALHRIAGNEGADLIVVGCAHHGPIGRVLLGDVSRGALHGAPCPVAVAPHRYPPRSTIATVGVAYNGSDEAAEALACAAGVAVARGATLRALFAVEPFTYATVTGYPVDVDAMFEDMRTDAQRRLDGALAHLPAEIDATGRAIVDTPHRALQDFASDVDLMVTGSRGFGPVRRVALGSTADRLVHHATTPVLVVPRGATAGHDEPGTVAEARKA